MEQKLKFKVGDRVRVKSMEWYNDEPKNNGDIYLNGLSFVEDMKKYCGEILTIIKIVEDCYIVEGSRFCWQDWIFEDDALTEEKQEVEQLNQNNMETKKKTLKEAQEFVKNTKYIVWSEDESRQLQEKLFEIGCKWHMTGTYLCHTEEPFLFVDNDLNIRCSTKSFYREFKKSEKRYIETDCIISIEIEQQKTKFDPKTLQPFDKVLVRDDNTEKWKCSLFSQFDCDSKFIYMCVSCRWKICIPYNEETKHLLGTTDEAPEFYRLD